MSDDFSSDPNVSIRRRRMTLGVVLEPYQADEIAAAREIGYPHIVRDSRIITAKGAAGTMMVSAIDPNFGPVIIDDYGEVTPEMVRAAQRHIHDAMQAPEVRNEAFLFRETTARGRTSPPRLSFEAQRLMYARAHAQPTLSAAMLAEARDGLIAQRVVPFYLGGRNFYGDPMSLQRERFQFIPHLIRNLRNTL